MFRSVGYPASQREAVLAHDIVYPGSRKRSIQETLTWTRPRLMGELTRG